MSSWRFCNAYGNGSVVPALVGAVEEDLIPRRLLEGTMVERAYILECPVKHACLGYFETGDVIFFNRMQCRRATSVISAKLQDKYAKTER